MQNTALHLVFWIALAIVVYAYAGYGLLLYALVWFKRRFRGRAVPPADSALPELSLVVCAYNEADCMRQKIDNCLALDYPRERLVFCFVTDGSDDATPDLVRQYPYPPGVRWTLLHQAERRGKIAAFQRAMEQIDTPVVVSTDANTDLNAAALRLMVRHFSDPQVGAVAGEKRIALHTADAASSAGEGIYWKYESALKKWDAELWSVVGAAGELFAFRKAAYEHVPTDTIIEDFYLTLRIAQKGFRVAYEPEAYARESSSASVGEELKRKIRIAAGGWQAIVRLAPLLNVFRYGVLSFQYFSHRVLRWTLAPAMLPLVLLTNAALAASGSRFFQALLLAQTTFYAAALLGYWMEHKRLKIKALFVPYYFCVMNYAVYAGFLRYLRGRQSVLWERAQRAAGKAG